MTTSSILPAASLALLSFALAASAQVITLPEPPLSRVATDASWSPTQRPAAMDGQWFGRVVRATDASVEGSEVMYAAHPGVLRNVIIRFDVNTPEQIASAAVNEYGGVREEDGGYLLLGKNVAVTPDAWMSADGAVGCISVAFDEKKETIFACAKSEGVETFEDCPAVPDPAAFEDVDLDAADADRAVILKKSPAALADAPFGLSASEPASASGETYAGAWPEKMPGFYLGTLVGSDEKYVSVAGAAPTIWSSFQGAAPNAWLFLDPEDHKIVASANVGLMRSVEENEDGSFTFRNDAWKFTPGPDHVAGRDDWCNTIVLRGDEWVQLSDSRARDERAEPTCPEPPENPEEVEALVRGVAADGETAKERLAERGAAFAGVLTRQ